MTKRKDPADFAERGRLQLDTTPKPRKKRGANATPEGKAKRVAALRASAPNTSANLATLQTANPDRPLTEKQKLFVSEWAKGETIHSASYRAGYADDGAMAYRMSRDPAILKIYNQEKALYEASCQMSRKQVMEGLLEAIDMAKLLGEPSSMIAGWKEIGRMAGYYEPVRKKIDINIQGDVTVKRLERMGDADLLKLIKGDVEDVVFEEMAAEEEE